MDESSFDERRAEEGQKDVWRRLYEENKEKILTMAFRFTRNLQDAEDILQESFIKAFSSLPSSKAEVNASASSWIYRVALNTAIDFYRRKRRRPEIGLGQNSTTCGLPEKGQIAVVKANPENLAMQSEIGRLIDEHVKRLPWRQRAVFILKYYEHLKIREIARLLGCSEGSVKRSLFRSVQNLRKNLSFLTTE